MHFCNGRKRLTIEEMKGMGIRRMIELSGISVENFMNGGIQNSGIPELNISSIESELDRIDVRNVYDLVKIKYVILVRSTNLLGVYSLGLLNEILYEFDLKIGMSESDLIRYAMDYELITGLPGSEGSDNDIDPFPFRSETNSHPSTSKSGNDSNWEEKRYELTKIVLSKLMEDASAIDPRDDGSWIAIRCDRIVSQIIDKLQNSEDHEM